MDAATLTGAIVVALGHVNIGAFTNNDEFLGRVMAASKAEGEKTWHMPLDEDYKELLKSAFADLGNIGGRWGGAISAAWFLREFVGDVPWAHLDIAGNGLAGRCETVSGERTLRRRRSDVHEARHELVSFEAQRMQHEIVQREIAFEMAAASIRFGDGVTREVGMDLAELGARSVLVVTDPALVRLSPVQTVLESLHANRIPFAVYDSVRVEPTDESFQDAIRAARESSFDAFVAVGGGSVIDTAKAVNLYTTYPPADFLD